MAQLVHPQPQEDFPFLLLRTILAATAATIMIRTAQMMIVAMFPIIHVSIGIPPVFLIPVVTIPTGNACYFAIFSFMSVVSFVASL